MIQATLFGAEQAEFTSDDYYTPAWVFKAMGLEFDLDVCSPPQGVPWVPAKRRFSLVDDGLSQPWHGRVWMNPPYSGTTPWVDRFIEHGNGVALLPMAKSCWVNKIWSAADAVAISEQGGEMHFVRPDQPKPLRIWFPVFFAAFGAECVEAVGRVGDVR